jgi:hypothetical protein
MRHPVEPLLDKNKTFAQEVKCTFCASMVFLRKAMISHYSLISKAFLCLEGLLVLCGFMGFFRADG